MGALERIEPRVPTMDDLRAFAEAAVKSRFYGFTSVEQMIPLMLVAQSQGRSFVSVVEEYSLISNRPALKAEAMLARFQKAGGHIQWTKLGNDRCAAIFSHQQCAPVEVDWDMDRAKLAGIAGKDNWKKYPRQMLKARVISDGVRLAYPACLGGLYTPEENLDMEPAHVSPNAQRGQLAAPEEAGELEQPREPFPSVRVSFTASQDDDGIGKGKSAYAARKDGDWERVKDRLMEELKAFATRGEAIIWWEKTVEGDEEYKALPAAWRKTFRDEFYIPHTATLDDGLPPKIEGAAFDEQWERA